MINQTFNAALYGADAKEITSLGENYVEIINRVKNNFKET